MLTERSPFKVWPRGTNTGGVACLVALVLALTACSSSSPTAPVASSTPASSAAVSSSTATSLSSSAPPVATSTMPAATPTSSSVTAVVAPICAKEALQDAVNAGRESPLTVGDSDFQCQDTWAVVGANDLVNKAQYTYLLQWTDGQWHLVADRSQACAGGAVPAALFALGCQSN